MNEHTLAAANTLKERLDAEVYEFRDQLTALLSPDQIVEACRLLRDDFQFELLTEETAVDYWPQEQTRFHVVYGVRSLRHNSLLLMRVPLDGNYPSLPTIEEIYPNANWFERELWDMFGIRFEGHSDMRRIIMPADWEGHPLRKDYPLGYEEPQFTFNIDEVQAKKLNPKE
jgi:NADH-quinone oxidoreductase subunit C